MGRAIYSQINKTYLMQNLLWGGSASPMLAKDYRKDGHKVKFPVAVQPKIDGMRLLYNSFTGEAFSRGGKTGKTGGLSALLDALAIASFGGVTLDGELYVHGASFQEVMRRVHNGGEGIEYHVFDIVSTDGFMARHALLKKLLEKAPAATRRLVKLVPTELASSSAAAERYLEKYTKAGYEGVMLRDPTAPYFHGRSSSLFKFKRFSDHEFKVVGYKPHKNGGVVWKCETAGGKTFYVTPNAALKAETGANADKYVGKYLTVQYQAKSEDGVPRFPIGKAFRAAADLGQKRARSPSRGRSPGHRRSRSPKRSPKRSTKRSLKSPRKAKSPRRNTKGLQGGALGDYKEKVLTWAQDSVAAEKLIIKDKGNPFVTDQTKYNLVAIKNALEVAMQCDRAGDFTEPREVAQAHNFLLEAYFVWTQLPAFKGHLREREPTKSLMEANDNSARDFMRSRCRAKADEEGLQRAKEEADAAISMARTDAEAEIGRARAVAAKEIEASKYSLTAEIGRLSETIEELKGDQDRTLKRESATYSKTIEALRARLAECEGAKASLEAAEQARMEAEQAKIMAAEKAKMEAAAKLRSAAPVRSVSPGGTYVNRSRRLSPEIEGP